MKASDISDFEIYRQVLKSVRRFRGEHNGLEPVGAIIWHIQEALEGYPAKVVLAKCRQMIAKKRLDGCGCGCRGDFNIPERLTVDGTLLTPVETSAYLRENGVE